MGSRKANVMVVGKTGSGKTMTLSQVTQFFLAKSDVSQLKERYTGNDGERIAEAIRQNCNIWYPLKPGDEGQ
ncbi:Clp protease [Enterobacter hormaechei]|uniref:Clp protease n=1 Tax=Enterobacteriaceae TaxID=543 RepID=UPI002026FF42|nr:MULTISPECIES: Clp protease [Enterobacteriaceae]MCM7891631.1 Clp protease [Enterobacter hormaechei]MCM7896316.1 Clp protease [Enterobacter hormaechei]MCM7901032.1 Clp protease [Enterobacter hormaechei]MCM7905537.1 Clp protease [Enterobacter hormaechei]MCM7915154.1 Clp protease [Enterobacter hormaechei]